MATCKRLALRAGFAASLGMPLLAHATTVTVPEPGAWSLLGLGFAAAAVAAIRKRRK
jgi:hypothetical protein